MSPRLMTLDGDLHLQQNFNLWLRVLVHVCVHAHTRMYDCPCVGVRGQLGAISSFLLTHRYQGLKFRLSGLVPGALAH